MAREEFYLLSHVQILLLPLPNLRFNLPVRSTSRSKEARNHSKSMCRLLASEDAKSFGIVVLSISIHFDMHSVEPTSPACRHTLHSICRFRSDCVNSNGFRRIASTLFRCSFLLSSPSQNAIGGKCWKKFPSSQPGDEWLELWFGGRGRHMCHHFGREALSSFGCHLPPIKKKKKKVDHRDLSTTA